MLEELGEVAGVDVAVRVNSVQSGLLEDDLNVVMAARRLPQTILLPKADTVEDIILVGVSVCLSVCVCLCVFLCVCLFICL